MKIPTRTQDRGFAFNIARRTSVVDGRSQWSHPRPICRDETMIDSIQSRWIEFHGNCCDDTRAFVSGIEVLK
jgi:hypothetical protein